MMRGLGERSDRLGLAAIAGLFLVSAAGMFGSRAWPFELLSHFVLQYLVGAGLLCLVLAATGRKAAAAAALVFAVGFAAAYQQAPRTSGDMAPVSIGAARASTDIHRGLPSRGVGLVTYNVSKSNRRPEAVDAWLAGRPADVVVLQEVPEGMADRLRSMNGVYPHQFIVEPGARLNSEVYAGQETLAILSIHPIAARGVVRPSGQGRIALVARLSIPGAEDPWIVTVHPAHPATPARLSARDSYLLDLAGFIAELDGPVIVAGDFNVTPYAPAFRLFLDASRTATARHFPATWPAPLGPLGVPIDHVLVRDARVATLDALPFPGSDHRPLRAEILLPAATGEPRLASRP